MTDLILTTYDWVPAMPRGYVRDIRIRWALEEAGLPYRVDATPFRARGPAHLAHQPFAQVPWLADGDLSLFESGAILLHLGERSPVLMPAGGAARAEVIQWLFAALNSVEMASLPWWLASLSGEAGEGTRWHGFLGGRLDRLEPVLASREWLAGAFSIADIAMADVLRLPRDLGRLGDHPACDAYVERAMARPAFRKAHADQMAHFAHAD